MTKHNKIEEYRPHLTFSRGIKGESFKDEFLRDVGVMGYSATFGSRNGMTAAYAASNALIGWHEAIRKETMGPLYTPQFEFDRRFAVIRVEAIEWNSVIEKLKRESSLT